jgi:2-methylcitrate dehydratase PrpD
MSAQEDDPKPSKTERLASFNASIRRETLPASVVHEAKRALIDWIAAVLAGSQDPAARKLQDVIAGVAPEAVATVVGTSIETSAPFAALANGYASHLQDYDDVFNPVETTVHLGSCVWPVVMAISQLRPLSGAEAIASFVAGFETGARVGRAAGLAHYESSWQVSGTAGHLASAAAAARAFKLGPAETTNALGIAAAQASGIREIYGSDTKALQPGKAAMDGVLAGLLAEHGFTSRTTALEGPRGLLSAISPTPDPEILVAEFNQRWHLLDNGYKLYPCASVIHPAIDAACAIADRPGFDARNVIRVEANILPFAASVTSVTHPKPGADAKFSGPHCIAVALLTGRVGLDDFDAATVADTATAELREHVLLIGQPSISKRSADVTVTLRDGTQLREVITENRGTPGNRLPDDELEKKLFKVAAPLIGTDAATATTNYCWDFDFVTDASDILATLRKGLEDGAA